MEQNKPSSQRPWLPPRLDLLKYFKNDPWWVRLPALLICVLPFIAPPVTATLYLLMK